MGHVAAIVRSAGGVALAAELRAHGATAADLRRAIDEGSLLRVRRGV